MDRHGGRTPRDLPVLITVPVLSELITVKKSWIYDAVARGEIPGVLRLGHQLRFRTEAILRWLDRLEGAGADEGSDGLVLERIGQLVAQADVPATKTATAPRRRGRRNPWQIPGQETPP